MKYNYELCRLKTAALFICGSLLLFSSAGMRALAQTEGKKDAVGKIAFDDLIASVRANNLDAFDVTFGKWQIERKQFANELLNVLGDTKSSNIEQCAATCYLGEMRVAESVDILAAEVTLNLVHSVDHLSYLQHPPAAEALFKIGIASIPALIGNLAEIDNPGIRTASLKILYRIEGDKDVVELRVQKALNVEKDSKRKARLQLALKELSGINQ
jgi:hypothetical protein